MAGEKIISALEDSMSAWERREEIVRRAKQLWKSRAFENLEPQDKETLGNYLNATDGGLAEGSPEHKEALAKLDKFLSQLENG